MKFGWVIIPLLVFVIALSIAAAQAVNTRRGIDRVMETAESNHWPIIVCSLMGKTDRMGIYTLEGNGGGFRGPVWDPSPGYRRFFFGIEWNRTFHIYHRESSEEGHRLQTMVV